MLVRVIDNHTEEAFGHVISVNDGNYTVRHIDDGSVFEYSESEILEYDYYDMLKELLYTANYSSNKAFIMSKEGLTIDGFEMSPEEALKLAGDIFEFYGGLH